MSPSDAVTADTSVETGMVIAHPWLCDINDHLNTRNYQGFFDDAAQHLLARCGFAGASAANRLGVVDVECTMRFHDEVPRGALLTIRSGFERLGGKSFVSWHEMVDCAEGKRRASCRLTSVFFDLAARRAVPMDETFRAAALPLVGVSQTALSEGNA